MTIRTFTPGAIQRALSTKVAVVDKDGVLDDLKYLVHENLRRGFEHVRRNSADNALRFEYSAETVYGLVELEKLFGGRRQTIAGLLAINRFAASEDNIEKYTPDEILSKIIKQGGARLGLLMKKYGYESDAKTADDIYGWDKGAFFKSEEGAEYVMPIQGAVEAFEKMLRRHNGNVGVLTNTSTRIEVERHFKRAGFPDAEIKEIFFLCAEDLGKALRKPNPEGLRRMGERFKSGPSEMSITGDGSIDMQAGINWNVSCRIGVETGAANYAQLALAGASMTAGSLKEITDLF